LVSSSSPLPYAKERGIEATKVQHYRGLRRAHNEQIFNRHKPVLDAMGDQPAYTGPIVYRSDRRRYDRQARAQLHQRRYRGGARSIATASASTCAAT
jgi:hypothetical protein